MRSGRPEDLEEMQSDELLELPRRARSELDDGATALGESRRHRALPLQTLMALAWASAGRGGSSSRRAAAPPTHSDLFARYNPRVLTPYFCVVDATGTVRARDAVGAGDWLRLRAEWEGASVERAMRWAAR